ncbi:MAG: TonB-dependent receptor [Gemmatimonadota bacterium]
MPRRIVLAATLLLALPGLARGQAGDVLRGRVVGEDSLPVEAAQVAVRSARTLELRAASTGRDGRWEVRFPDTSPAYEVSVRRVGKQPARLRLETGGSREVQAPTTVLADEAVAVAGITVSGRRPVVVRSPASPLPHERTAAQRWSDGTDTRADHGDFARVAGASSAVTLLPGEEGGPDRFSVAGLGADQNRVTVNGLSFGGESLPYFARLQGYATTATADASRGGFAGGEVAVSLWSGISISPEARLRVVSAEPGLQLAGPDADRLGLRYREWQANAQLQRWLPGNRASLLVAADAERRTHGLASALSGDAATLWSIGVAPDSAARLRSILGRSGIPSTAGGVPDRTVRDRYNLMVNLGLHRLFRGTEGGVHFNVQGRSATPVGVGSAALPATGGRDAQRSADAGVRLARDFGDNLYHELRASFHASRGSGTPFLRLPAARVTVASELEDGERALAGIGFGGSAGLPRDTRRSFAEAQHQVTWLSYDRRHQLRVGVSGRADRFRLDAAPNRLGTWTFSSLADLEDGRPASFSRTLGGRLREAAAWTGALYAEDAFTASERLELRFGARLEGGSYRGARGYNPAVDSLFGARTDRVPGELRLSPRLGFAWNSGTGLLARRRAPWGQLSGSVGEYRGTLDVAQLALRTDQNGLADGSRTLHCVGDAVPAPDWAAYAEDPSRIPAACADGLAGSALSGAAPWITVYGDGYAAPRRRAANLAWLGDTPLGPRLSLGAAYARGVAQPSAVDLNLDAAPRFALADEGGRPVFVPAASVVPGTGAVGLAPSRLHPELGVVSSLRSDAATEAAQLTVGILPPRRNPARVQLGGEYTRSWTRALARGASGEATAGDPVRLSWAPSAAAADHVLRGTLTVPVSRDPRRLSTVFVTGRLQSGLRFTPRVAGDVNGDGDAFNDAAFVFDPARTADPALAGGMRALLDDAPAGTRACLERHLGGVAERNGCAGPWTAALDLELQGNLRTPVGRSAFVSLRALNVLGGLDHLVHGAGGLRGWGEQAYVDPVLLAVRGFDPEARRFRYDVNPRFGSASAARARFRTPFVVRLEVNLTLARGEERAALDAVALQVQRAQGPQDTARAVTQYVQGISSVMRWLTRSPQLEDLLVTEEQAAALARLADAYEAEAAALTGEAVAYLRGALGRDPSEEILRRVGPAREARQALYLRYLHRVKLVLAPDQWGMLDPNLTNRVDSGAPAR